MATDLKYKQKCNIKRKNSLIYDSVAVSGFATELSCQGIFDLFNSSVVFESSTVCCFGSRNAALEQVLFEERA